MNVQSLCAPWVALHENLGLGGPIRNEAHYQQLLEVVGALMAEHDLRQGDLPEVGTQSVVSEVLAGKRHLNLRQVKALAARFAVPMELFAA